MEFVCDSCSQCSKSTSSSKVDARFVCGYRAVLRQSKRKEGIYARLPWGFKSGSTVKDLTHSDQCLSKARMTLCEARVHTELALTFRQEWVPKYFWAENFVRGYANVRINSPIVNNKTVVTVQKGLRVVTPPPQPPKRAKKKSFQRKESGLGRAGKRSRARWDEKGYVTRKRTATACTGPANPFVHITDTTIFHRQPCGRKGLTRSEGVKEAAERLKKAIEQQEALTAKRAAAAAAAAAAKRAKEAAKRAKEAAKRAASSVQVSTVSSAVTSLAPATSTLFVPPVPLFPHFTPEMLLEQQRLFAMYNFNMRLS